MPLNVDKITTGSLSVDNNELFITRPTVLGILGEFMINPKIIVSGTTDETILYSLLIPKNTFRVGDFVENSLANIEFGLTTNSGDATISVYYNSTNDLNGATFLNSAPRGTTELDEFEYGISKYGWKYTSNTEYIVLSNDILTYDTETSFDITQDNYFIFTVQLDGSSDVAALYKCFSRPIITR